jgi:hypothetical protein
MTRTRSFTTPHRIGAALAGALIAPVLVVAPALANDDDVIREGNCSGGTDWKVKASPEDGRIEVEGEIDSNRNGQVWKWRLKHNGSVTAKGSKTTTGRSGSFEVRRVLVDLQGADTFVFRATHNGEVCRGSVTF